MLRFHAALTSLLASFLVVPAFVGQGQASSLTEALNGTRRALEVLKGIEQRLHEDPAGALPLVFSATEAASGDEVERERRLEDLRSEVNLLQMELDALQSPLLAPDGSVQDALGARAALEAPRDARPLAITTGFDDAMRAMLTETPAPRAPRGGEARSAAPGSADESGTPAEDAYSADPLRHGITCYRAGRFAEAHALLAPLDGADALYWQARTLERLERLDEAVKTMERALAKGGEGFEARRAQTDLEFLRWKRDFMKSLPAPRASEAGKEPR